MLFSSMPFLFVFFPIVLLIYFLVLSKTYSRNLFLLIVSLIFYAYGEPVYVLIMILSILVNFKIGLWLEHCNNAMHRKCILCIGVLLNLSALFVFKYEGFAVLNLNSILGTSFNSLKLSLPIGISFFTFQALSYIIDVYRKDVPVQQNIMNLGLYISFFPQLIAGPIVRYNTIAQQIEERKINLTLFSDGLRRFISGLGKKIIIANTFAVVSEKSFASGDELSIAFAWLGALCYTFQIFFDFSGYSDMAIGLGKMFGFQFLENFNYPYISKSITEFWRRWHMSLGSWFRDYVYIPLGGSRVKTKRRLIFNLFIVWLLTGIWHGASWRFVAWGLLYFVLLTFEKLTNIPKKSNHFITKNMYQCFTMFVVIIGWVIFGESSFKNAIRHLLAMFGLLNNKFIDTVAIFEFKEVFVFLIIAALLSTPIFKNIDEKICRTENRIAINVLAVLKVCFYILLFILSISYLAIGAHNPFIYFNF